MSNPVNTVAPLSAGDSGTINSVEFAPAKESYFTKVVDDVFSSIDASHGFLQQMINYSGTIDVKKTQQVQAAIEEFSLNSALASKTISLVIRGVDTLVKIQ
jgi:hypothetical protein